MLRFKTILCIAGAITIPTLATTAQAQATDTGIYAVARGGVSVSPDQKFNEEDLPATATFDSKTKYDSGFTGELGGGYDFGMFRLEQTAGYMSSKAKGLDEDGFTGTGRNKSMFVSINGYVDIPLGSSVIQPFVGGGVGAARVNAKLSRTDTILETSTSYADKDWGLMWHADAGVGFAVAPKVTLEVGGRYTQISGLKFDGVSGGDPAVFEPKIRNISGTVGVRYKF
jgi:opacity protein-like surface antigen